MNTEKEKLITLLKADLINNPIESSAPVHQPMYFEEFHDIKTSLDRNGFYKKYSLISKYLEHDLSHKNILDIGSNAGFFSFAVADRNGLVDAIEPSLRYFRLCQQLCKIYNVSNINFINDSISKDFLAGKKYDYGFMLSVYQWIEPENPFLREKILMEISKHVNVLFFELGCNSGKSAIKTNKINHIAYIYRLLKNNTVYKNIKLIGKTMVWRNSPRYLYICSNQNLSIREPFYSFLKSIYI